jgi:hypothetical protein
MSVKLSLVASAHESGEGGAVDNAGPDVRAALSEFSSPRGDTLQKETGDLVGREKFSTDLDSLMSGVEGGGRRSLGGGSGRGGVTGRSGMMDEVGDWG